MDGLSASPLCDWREGFGYDRLSVWMSQAIHKFHDSNPPAEISPDAMHHQILHIALVPGPPWHLQRGSTIQA